MFGRLVHISIKNDSGSELVLVDANDENALICEADISCMPSKERTSAEIVINNLDSHIRNIIKTDNYKYITIKFGYKDVDGSSPSSIFEGTLQRMITKRPSPETSQTIMYAYELGDVYNYGWFSGVILKGTSLYDAAIRIANEGEINIPIEVTDILKGYEFQQDTSLYGSQMNLLQQIASSVSNIIFMHSMGKVHMITTTENSNSEVIVMSGMNEAGKLVTASGLIGLPTLEDDGLSFECLVNPKLKIYSTVLIANEFIGDAQEGFESSAEAGAEYDDNGLYVVLKIDTHITNGPSESKMHVRALARSYYMEEE